MRNYIIVNHWTKGRTYIRFELIKGISAQGSKGERLAQEYERELNNGYTHKELWAKGQLDEFYTTCYTPYSQAREYRNFNQWENQ
jgi:hypothetical protein